MINPEIGVMADEARATGVTAMLIERDFVLGGEPCLCGTECDAVASKVSRHTKQAFYAASSR